MVLGGSATAPSYCGSSPSHTNPSPYKLLQPQNTTLVSLACTITYQLDTQHNHTSLYYFLCLFWPQFASLQLLLPSFLRNLGVVALQFLFITSRCTATAHLLTTIQASVHPLNSTCFKSFSKYLKLLLSRNRAFSRRLAAFHDRVAARAARSQDAAATATMCCHHSQHCCQQYRSRSNLAIHQLSAWLSAHLTFMLLPSTSIC